MKKPAFFKIFPKYYITIWMDCKGKSIVVFGA